MPGDNVVDLHARRRRRQRRRRLRRARREDVRGQGPLGERRRDAARSTTTSGTSRARTSLVSSEFGEPNAYEPRLRPRRRRPRAATAAPPLLEPRRAARSSRRSTSASRARPARGPLAPRPGRRGGLRRRGALEHDVALPPRNGVVGGRPGDRRRERRARGLAVPRAGPDHRPRALDGRPLPLLLELAARRPAPVRRLRPGEPEADRPAVARRRCSGSRATPGAS